MQLILEILAGVQAGKQIKLKPGNSVRIGRTQRADISFPDDPSMSAVHFGVRCDAKGCELRDYNSTNGTLLNGKRVQAAILAQGDRISAGQALFLVQVEQEGSSTPSPEKNTPPPTPQSRLVQMLRSNFQPLFTVLDAAREPSVLKVLFESGLERRSLFEGPQAGRLTHFAPYLVHIPADSPFLEHLVNTGWGKSWGIYVTSNQPVEETRKHLRSLLRVTLPDRREAYFRFYDPRVLRMFLPTCLPGEVSSFFGFIRYYLMENEKGDALLRFSNSGRGVGLRTFPLLPSETGEMRLRG